MPSSGSFIISCMGKWNFFLFSIYLSAYSLTTSSSTFSLLALLPITYYCTVQSLTNVTGFILSSCFSLFMPSRLKWLQACTASLSWLCEILMLFLPCLCCCWSLVEARGLLPPCLDSLWVIKGTCQSVA
ncbi:hypothetical protein FGO68_gene3069 [Halteria grandinella]|uniref:Uncharacterized protein n=1 Tax=Halteria grandinella TaxID=5974 RepID=A0A8J8SX27_HALGN|nr:hypothetical protein FGO68_gene3069 [Halteria grandinella]